MSLPIQRKQLEDIIINMERRLARLETGGRPMAGLSGDATGTFALAGNTAQDNIAITLAWDDPDIQAQPKGDPYITIYVDTDNDSAYEWPYGASLSAGQKNMEIEMFKNWLYLKNNPNQSRVSMRIANRDSGSHTYYLHVAWVYLKGASGSA
jgi:hypothetical protein